MNEGTASNMWRVRVAAGEYGPLDLETVRAWVGERRVGLNDFVLGPEMRQWTRAGAVAELAGLFPMAPVLASPHVVGGWLLFFCVLVVIVGPVSTLLNWANTSQTIDKLLGPGHPLKRQMTISLLSELPVLLFGVYAGIRLWQVKPGAVTTAKVYLWARLGLTVVSFVVAKAMGFNLDAISEAMQRKHGIRIDLAVFEVPALVFSIVWILIWYWYFCVSKRVKATYGVGGS